MKKKLLLFAMLLSSICSFAIDSVTFSDVTIMPGATGEVEVSYTSSDEEYIYSAFQIEIKLPDGVNVVEANLGEDVYENSPQMRVIYNNVSNNGERSCTFVGFSPSTLTGGLPTGEHQLFTFTLAADEEVALGEYALDVPCVEFTKVPVNATGTGNINALFLPATTLNLTIDFIVKNEEDLHFFFEWLGNRQGDNLRQQLNLHGVNIPLTYPAEIPEDADLTITNGSFSAGEGWNGATVFTVPSTSNFALDNINMDFSNQALPTSLTLFDVAGTLYLNEGTNIKGGGTTAINPSSGTVTLNGARLNGVELIAGEEMNLFSSAPLANNITVRVPEDQLHEGFRIMGPEDNYELALTDAFSVVVANDPKAWCVEVDDEGYLSLFPSFMLGDVNVDGEVNITDIILVVSYVLGDDVKMRIAAANVVRDKIISIADIAAIVSIVLD